MRFSLRWLIPSLLSSISLLHAQSPATPGNRASIDSLFPQLEDYIRDGMQKTGVPGVAVAIVYQDKVVYMKGFGVREAGRPDLDVVSSQVPSQGFLTPDVAGGALIGCTDGVVARRTVEIGSILMKEERRCECCVCA